MKHTTRWLAVISSDVDLEELYEHLAPYVHKVHKSVKGKARRHSQMSPGVVVPKSFYSQAIDTNAYGYIALPQSYWESFDDECNLTLSTLGVVRFTAPANKQKIRRIRYIAKKSGVWHVAAECLTIEQDRARVAAERYNALPTEFTLSMLTEAQELVLADMLEHMNYWQSYFRTSLHGDPVTRADKGRVEAWALRLLCRTRINGRRHPIYTTTISALRRMMLPKYFGSGGVKTLIFEDPEGIEGRTIQLGAAGSVTLEQTPPKGMHVIDVDYDQEVGVFFATFKQSM